MELKEIIINKIKNKSIIIDDLVKQILAENKEVKRQQVFYALKDIKAQLPFIEFNGSIYDTAILNKKQGFVHWSPNMSCWVDNVDKTNEFGICFDLNEKEILVHNKKNATPGAEIDYFEFTKNEKKYAYIWQTYEHKKTHFLIQKKNDKFYCLNNNNYLEIAIENQEANEGDILEYFFENGQWNFIEKISNINDAFSESIICKKLAKLQEPFHIDENNINKFKEITKNKQVLDLRHLPFTTVDAVTTKDVDDAVYLEKTDNGYKLYVAIADVSSYVEKNDDIDLSAKESATTYYLNHNKVSMIDKSLSEDIASLNLGEDKLSFVCIIDFDENNQIQSSDFFEAKINVKYKIPYDDLDIIIQEQSLENVSNSYVGKNDVSLKDLTNEDAKKLIDYFTDYFLFSQKLKKYNNEQNYFFVPTPDYILNDDGKIDKLFIEERNRTNPSQTIVETSMLSANICAANYLLKSYPYLGMYRNQKTPDDEKAPKAALYEKDNDGHYSLEEMTYTHFTSPIRRFCDLVIHRLIKASINETSIYNEKEINEISQNINIKNFISKQLEIKQKDLLMNQYLEKLVKNKELKNKFEFVSFNESGVLIRNKQLIDIFVPYFKTSRDVENFFKQHTEKNGKILYDIVELANAKFQLKCFVDKYDYTQDRIDFTLKIYPKENNSEKIDEISSKIEDQLNLKKNKL